MADIKENSARNIRAWHGIFSLLSLDCMIPFWAEMSLIVQASYQETLRDAARTAYLTIQGGELRNYAANCDTASVNSALKRFEESLSTVDLGLANLVMGWTSEKYIASASEGALESTWWGALVDLKNEYPSLKHPLSLSEKTLALLVEKISSHLLFPYNDISARLKKIRYSTLSDWDKRMCHASTIDVNASEVGIPYISVVEMQIVRLQLLHFWGELKSLLTQREIEILFDWYSRQSAHVIKVYPYLKQIPAGTAVRRSP